MFPKSLKAFQFFSKHHYKLKGFKAIEFANVARVKNSKILAKSIKSLNELDIYLQDPVRHEKEIQKLRRKNAEIISKHLDAEILKALKSLGKSDTQSDLLILKNFPFDKIENVSQAEQVQLGLSYLTNMNPFTYKTEYKGRLIHHIRPKIEKENDFHHSSSSKRALDFHTENAFNSKNLDFLMLYCLKSDKNAATRFVSSKAIFQTLSPQIRDEFLNIGTKYNFIHFSSASHDCEAIKVRGPLFTYNQTNKLYPIELRLNPHTIGINDESNEMLIKLKEHIAEISSEIVLESGDVCIWYNHSFLHGRSAYQPNYSDERNKRFLLRLFLSKNPNLPIVL